MTAKKEVKSKKPAKAVKTEVKEEEEEEVEDEVVSEKTGKSKLPTGPAPKQRYSLYVRGPKWIKDRENSEARLKALNARIVKVFHPRQKGADYAYIDFASAEDRDKAYEEMLPLKEVNVQHARKDDEKLVEARKAKVLAKREAKCQLKALMKNVAKNEIRERHSKKPKKLSNQIVILNLPKVTTQIELKEHFDNIVDTKLDVDKNPKRTLSKAILTLATPKEALNASEKKITLHGIKLKIKLHQNVNELRKFKRIEKAKKRKLVIVDKKDTEEASDEPETKRPLILAPEKLENGSGTTKVVKKKKNKKAGKEVKVAKGVKTGKVMKVTKVTQAVKVAKKVKLEKAVKQEKPTLAPNKSTKSLVKAKTPKKASPAKKVVKKKE